MEIVWVSFTFVTLLIEEIIIWNSVCLPSDIHLVFILKDFHILIMVLCAMIVLVWLTYSLKMNAEVHYSMPRRLYRNSPLIKDLSCTRPSRKAVTSVDPRSTGIHTPAAV